MGGLSLQLHLPSAVLGQLVGAAAAALGTHICRPPGTAEQSLSHGTEKQQDCSVGCQLLPSCTGPHQSPSYAVLFLICVAAGKRHAVPTAS